MSGRFGALSNGAVVEEIDDCTCGCGREFAHEPGCGLELIGFLAPMPGANTRGTVFDFCDPDLLPSMLWDFSGVDYSAQPYGVGYPVSGVE